MKNEFGEKMRSVMGGKSNNESEMNAIELLKADHRKVEGLFKEFEESKIKRQMLRLASTIIKELTAHTAVEEKLVYPLLGLKEDKTQEAYEEHHAVKIFLAELSGMDGSEQNFKAKVKVISEMVKHHVKEEESGLLKELKKSGTDLDALGAKIREQKAKIGATAKKPVAKQRQLGTATRRRKAS